MVFVDLKENHREKYRGYVITTEYTKNSKLIGDRIYTAIAKKDGIVIDEYQSALSFKNAVDEVKNNIKFSLQIQD